MKTAKASGPTGGREIGEGVVSLEPNTETIGMGSRLGQAGQIGEQSISTVKAEPSITGRSMGSVSVSEVLAVPGVPSWLQE